MESYTNGIVRTLIAQAGDTITIGGLIAIIGGADEDISALLPASAPTPAIAAPDARPAGGSPVRSSPPAPTPTQERGAALAIGRSVKASPLALRMAAEAGVNLTAISGTGPQGRIIKRDIEAAMVETPAPPAAASRPPLRTRSVAVLAPRDGGPEFQELELSSVRRTIAKRLVQSKGPVPHFYLTVEVAMDQVWAAYTALREEKSTVSINDIIIKATALALRQHPEINASFAGDHIKQYSRIHIGMAVSLDDGLITPVLRDADLKPLEAISDEARMLADRARARKLQPNEYTGATFSISNLGMMGIEEFSAIINPPEAAILAVGSVRHVPVVVDGVLATGYRMKMTLSVDHRVSDGASGARFLQTLTRFLEHPLLMA
jgi:pyruvate dehydrogenase E2 component (dihydrolipoamide acetyltransferase)